MLSEEARRVWGASIENFGEDWIFQRRLRENLDCWWAEAKELCVLIPKPKVNVIVQGWAAEDRDKQPKHVVVEMALWGAVKRLTRCVKALRRKTKVFRRVKDDEEILIQTVGKADVVVNTNRFQSLFSGRKPQILWQGVATMRFEFCLVLNASKKCGCQNVLGWWVRLWQ